MDWEPVVSSSIARLAYCASTQVLGVEFIRSGRYEYLGVSLDAHAALLSAGSKGRHINQFIKGRYPHRRWRGVAP